MRFCVKKIEVLLFLVFFCLFTSLGVWQLMRADEKRSIENRINARSQSDALLLEGPLEQNSDELEYQNISVRGEFLVSGQLLIDNILRNSQAGYHVITPFRLAGTDWSILVNRGWIAQNGSRQTLPEIALPGGEVVLQGIIRTPSHLPFVESSMEVLQNDASFNLWLYLDLDKYSAESSLNILPFAMLQNNDTGDGLVRDWPPYQAKTAMHIGYAIQWFAFALIVTFIFIGLGRKHAKREVSADVS